MELKGLVPPDPEGGVSDERIALIRTPRRNRKRFPAACVQVVDDPAAALASAGPGLHPARVVGPSKSSEGQYIFYLVEWLD